MSTKLLVTKPGFRIILPCIINAQKWYQHIIFKCEFNMHLCYFNWNSTIILIL